LKKNERDLKSGVHFAPSLPLPVEKPEHPANKENKQRLTPLLMQQLEEKGIKGLW